MCLHLIPNCHEGESQKEAQDPSHLCNKGGQTKQQLLCLHQGEGGGVPQDQAGIPKNILKEKKCNFVSYSLKRSVHTYHIIYFDDPILCVGAGPQAPGSLDYALKKLL